MPIFTRSRSAWKVFISMSGLGQNALIATKIDALTKTNNRLQRMVAQVNTPAYTDAVKVRLQKDRESAMNLSQELMSLLQNTPKSDSNVKLGQQFKEQLGRFETISVELCSKDKQLLESSFLLEEGQSNAQSNYGATHQQLLLEKTKVLSSEEMDQVDVSAMREREREIMQVEKDVAHIHEMFTDLHSLVVEQGEHLDLIESNITHAAVDVEAGLSELTKAEDYQRRNRNKKCILVIFFAVVIAVIVLFATKTFNG